MRWNFKGRLHMHKKIGLNNGSLAGEAGVERRSPPPPPQKIKKWTPVVTVTRISRCPCVTSCLAVQNVVVGGVPARGFWVIHSEFTDSCRNSRLCFHHQAFTSPHSGRANHIISISFYFIYSLLPFPRLLSDGCFT